MDRHNLWHDAYVFHAKKKKTKQNNKSDLVRKKTINLASIRQRFVTICDDACHEMSAHQLKPNTFLSIWNIYNGTQLPQWNDLSVLFFFILSVQFECGKIRRIVLVSSNNFFPSNWIELQTTTYWLLASIALCWDCKSKIKSISYL